jgi:hypothetical protein
MCRFISHSCHRSYNRILRLRVRLGSRDDCSRLNRKNDEITQPGINLSNCSPELGSFAKPRGLACRLGHS